MVLTMTAGLTSTKPPKNSEEQDLLLTGPGGCTARLRAEEGEKCGPGALPLLRSKCGMSRVSWIHTLLENLKYKSGD